MAEEMNNLVQIRGHLKGSITRALAYAESPPDDCTYDQITTRLDRLEEVWEQFVKSVDDMHLFRNIPDFNDPEQDFSVYEEKYLVARGRMATLKRDLTPIVQAEDHGDAISKLIEQQASFLKQFSAASNSSSHTGNDLPKINIPQFSGQYKDWPSFRDLFVSTIDSKPNLTSTQKFHYLKSLLRDDAATLIKHILVTDSAYTTAWTRLLERFDRPRHIVNSFIETFMSLPSTTNENCSILRKISDGANETIRGLDAIGQNKRDCWLIHLLLAKIDPESRRKWIQDSRQHNNSPTISDFFEFLDSRCEELELSQRKSNLTSRPQGTQKSNSCRSFVSVDEKAQNCIKCNATDHSVNKCNLFLSMSVDDRRAFVKSKSLCFNCLKSGHSSYTCNSKFRCKDCHKRHHTLVHSQQIESPTSISSSTPSTSSAAISSCKPWSTVAHVSRPGFLNFTTHLDFSPTVNHGISHHGSRYLLPTALVEVRNSQNRFVTCRILLDCASELSYISERCAQALGLPRSHSRIAVSGISSVKAETTRGSCLLHIKSKVSQHILDVCVHVLSKITSSLPTSQIDTPTMEQLREVTLADPTFNSSSPIDILLGVDQVWKIFTFNKIFDSSGNPIAISSIFGWIVTSVIASTDNATSSFVAVADIDRSLQRFWEIEETNYMPPADPDDIYVENHFLTTHARHSNGKYIVELPFKEKFIQFGDTLRDATLRFNAVERRLLRDTQLRQQYVAFMREYINLGHMRELHPNEIVAPDGRVFYMPHHPVVGPKLRVVFDGSFQDVNGVSLNSMLHIGPSIQRNLFAVCLRFRMYRYVFSADIVKMFRQILVSDNHRNYQRIVWREDPSGELKHFQLCTVTYGTSCAPFLSVRVLEQLAKDYDKEYPVAAKTILQDFYVDDVITGSQSEHELIEKRDELIQLLSHAGLELRKWVSNCSTVTSSFCDQPDQWFLKADGDETTKVLGIYWKPCSDVLGYKVSLEKFPKVTKRQVLSDVSRVFDPLGLLAPIIIQFKIFFQELWLLNLHWDDPLPPNLAEWWLKSREDLSNISNLSLPRFVHNSSDYIELQGFSDASIKAYSAAVYCRFKDNDGDLKVALIAAKTRVAPLKQVSLPRLELCGALLLVRLLNSVKEALPHKEIEVKAWCDSTVVLAWLSQPPVKLKTFVANRTAEILDSLPRNAWRHVISKDNPADCASRGMTALELLDFNLWWNGPAWLTNDEIYNSKLNKVEPSIFIPEKEIANEMKTSTINMVSTEISNQSALGSLAERISSWKRLVRIMSYVLYFIKKTRKRDDQHNSGQSTFDKINEARLACLRLAQNCYIEDRIKLQTNQDLSKGSHLIKLAPFVDENGLLRVGGRIRNSTLDETIRHPIILPKEHRITHLILLDEHQRNLHPGVSALFVHIRQTYWIFGARNLIRKLTHKCIKCFRQRQLTTQQFMADLPAVRVRQAHPFENTGCDYAGPLTLKLYRGRNARTSKGYICLFVCLVTSAIHLELATDLSTDCFLAALRRFMSRRGKCSRIYSDNGRNFLGASHVLNEMHKALMSQSHNEIVAASLAEDGIRWIYIPPHAPHWGGIWESAVRSVKLHLRRVIGNTILTFEQMHTLLAQIEAVVNSRPLGTAPDSDTNYLSPSHFLIGRPYTMVPEGDLGHINVNKLDYWQHIQNMYQGFWHTWHQEYLTSLQNRPKWSRPQPNVAVGNIVVVKENNTPPAKWLMAKVTEIYPGTDGLVRVVKLKTANGEMTRPITKIVVLPLF